MVEFLLRKKGSMTSKELRKIASRLNEMVDIMEMKPSKEEKICAPQTIISQEYTD